MIASAAAAVHTTGVNWESLGVIIAAIATGCTIFFTISERRSARIERQITGAVNGLSDVLLAKLETKETVSALRVTVAELQQWKRDMERRRKEPG